MHPSWQPLFDRLAKLKSDWPARAWSWDSRLICITSSFTVEFDGKARSAALAALPLEYNAATLAKAPMELRRVAERSGGLRMGQMLLTAKEIGPQMVPFGLWWPWGDGMTTSFRVGLDGLEWDDEPYPRMREIFGVSL